MIKGDIKMKVGEKFHRLICIKHIDIKRSEFRCDCGNVKIIERGEVVRGKAKSCGCLLEESRFRKIREWVEIDKGDHFEIPLTRGMFAKIDKNDLELISGFSWSACKNDANKYYAITCRLIPGYTKRKSFSMQNIIMQHTPTKNSFVDHINSNDTLNNRRNNLRIVTRQQNNMNRRSTNKTGFKGLSIYGNKIRVKVKKDGKVVYIHFFNMDEMDIAIAAYEENVKKFHGEYANTECIKKE
jgi:hypothetical protein